MASAWAWLAAALMLAGFILLVIFVILPATSGKGGTQATDAIPVPPAGSPGGCQCYSDVWARAPGSAGTSPEYLGLESKDNKTFCGFDKDGFRWACKPSDCTPACS
jgi:hypothetical protein